MVIHDDTQKSILIIGNGFDLNLGLKTSYNDFLKSSNFNSLLNSKNNLAIHLKNKHDLANWIDIENELKNYSHNGNVHFRLNFEQDFENLSNELKKYLLEIDYSSLNKNSKAYELFKKIAEEDFLIFDFNYTRTAKSILSELRFRETEIDARLIKVHGSIDDDIIFGVEDNANLFPGHVFLRKAYSPNFKGVRINEHIKNTNKLYIFGHSLGETDHMYFEDFFNERSIGVMNYSSNIITLYYYGKASYTQLLTQLDSMTLNKLTKFKQNNQFITVDTSK